MIEMISNANSSLPFTLQKDEQILAEVKPEKRDFILFRIVNNLLMFVALIILFVFFLGSLFQTFIIGVVFLFFLILPFIEYSRFKYWVTNQRIVGSGLGISFAGYQTEYIPSLIGFNEKSIHLENIDDVVLSQYISNRILNLYSLFITPHGEIKTRLEVSKFKVQSYGNLSGNGITGPILLHALKLNKALELKALLLKLRDQKK
ncbi:MAG: hypothetical protein NT051_05800 [Candidatus Micrarchaeota archaeon]|nr:hypothetical protein [Candidatus Micrarchaeota archaeon]